MRRALSPRDYPTRLARDPRYQSTSRISRDARSYRRRRDGTTKWSRATDTDAVINGGARANPGARCVASLRRDESYLRHARAPGQVSRRVKRARVKYDGVSRRIIFFSSRLFFAPVI